MSMMLWRAELLRVPVADAAVNQKFLPFKAIQARIVYRKDASVVHTSIEGHRIYSDAKKMAHLNLDGERSHMLLWSELEDSIS